MFDTNANFDNTNHEPKTHQLLSMFNVNGPLKPSGVHESPRWRPIMAALRKGIVSVAGQEVKV